MSKKSLFTKNWEQQGTLIVAYGEDGAVICNMAEPYPKSGLAEFELLRFGSAGWSLQMNNARLIIAAPSMYEKLLKVKKWLERLVSYAEHQLITCRFETLCETLKADIKNFKATIDDIDLALPDFASK